MSTLDDEVITADEADAVSVPTELDTTDPVTEGADAQPTEDADDTGDADAVDYEELMRSDLATLRELFPEPRAVGSIAEIKNAMRYAALRDLGLSAEEAYLAARGRREKQDNRGHLQTAPKRNAHPQSAGMPRAELVRARELFSGLSDREIQKLYKKVSR